MFDTTLKATRQPLLSKIFSSLALSVALACSAHADALKTDRGLQEIIVSAEFRDLPLLSLPNSITVLDASVIRDTHAQHLDQVLGRAPNVNFSSGASRGRFFQIRGIGERSQFVDPVNPSVGLIIDGIDFTGLGLAANTLDIEQIEILRGPQGTLYGANALAGLINFRSPGASESLTASITTQITEFDGRLVEGVISGPASDTIGYRLAARLNKQDGDYENTFLNRDDTNNIDEQVIKGGLEIQANQRLAIAVNALWLDIDNGYDAFSLRNNRQTGSDQPGQDTQETLAGAVTLDWDGTGSFDLQTVVSAADSDTVYSFDEDWSFIAEFDPGLFPYSSADSFKRSKENTSIDIRLISKPYQNIFNDSTDWVLGFYQRFERETLQRLRFADLAPDIANAFANKFKTRNHAVYGQLGSQLNERLRLTTGLRIEQRTADYSDSAAIDRRTEETLFGGRISLEYQLDNGALAYGLISRGYKADGVNGQIISAAQSNPSIPDSTFFFDTETLLNYELGFKASLLENSLQIQTAVFYQDRQDAQTKQSIFNPADFSFDDYLGNAGADSMGLEIEATYQPSERLELYASLGLLDAEFKDFISISHVDARDDLNEVLLAPVDLGGRDVAHAPNYQFALGGEYEIAQNWFIGIDVEGKDEFFFSSSHNEKSSSYEIFHARIDYRTPQWDVSLWARNIGDEDVEIRGFYFSNAFGNNPGNGYAPETYTQLGEPRIVGLAVKYTVQ